MNRGKTRSSLLGLVAVYLLYIAYELFQGRNDPETTMTPAARILFIVFFVLASVAILIYAYRIWKKSGQEEEKTPRDQNESLK